LGTSKRKREGKWSSQGYPPKVAIHQSDQYYGQQNRADEENEAKE
jgi:hypothetical protein